MIDKIDRKILALLQENARYSNAEIARRRWAWRRPAFLSASKSWKEKVSIKGYHALVDPVALGLNLLAIVWVDLSDMKNTLATGRLLARVPGVQEVHHNAGPHCFLLKVRCESTDRLQEILLEINAIPEVRSTQTTIVLKPVKESQALPLGEE